LRLFRGEPVAAVSRELGVELHRLEGWRDRELFGRENGLRERNGDPLHAELDQAKERIANSRGTTNSCAGDTKKIRLKSISASEVQPVRGLRKMAFKSSGGK